MRDHIHTGLVPFLFSGLSAIVLIHVLRVIAAFMASHGSESGGKALGAFALAD